MMRNPGANVGSGPMPLPTGRRKGGRRVGSLLPYAIVAVLLLIGVSLVAMSVAGSPFRLGATDPTVVESATGVEATAVETADASGVAASSETVQTTGEAVTLVDVSELVDDLVDSVVRIEVTSQLSGRFRAVVSGSGSGIVVSENGTVVTNAHVVEDADEIVVILGDGTTYEATLVGIDTDADIAIVSIDASGLTPITIGSTDGLEVGDPVVAIGYPLGLEGAPTVTTGVVSALDRHLEDSNTSLSGVLQTDAAITEGSSGGALVDADGELIGMTTAVGVSSVGVEGIGFAIPVETVIAAASALAEA